MMSIIDGVTLRYYTRYFNLSYHIDNSRYVFLDCWNTIELCHNFLHHNHGLDRSLTVR